MEQIATSQHWLDQWMIISPNFLSQECSHPRCSLISLLNLFFPSKNRWHSKCSTLTSQVFQWKTSPNHPLIFWWFLDARNLVGWTRMLSPATASATSPVASWPRAARPGNPARSGATNRGISPGGSGASCGSDPKMQDELELWRSVCFFCFFVKGPMVKN